MSKFSLVLIGSRLTPLDEHPSPTCGESQAVHSTGFIYFARADDVIHRQAGPQDCTLLRVCCPPKPKAENRQDDKHWENRKKASKAICHLSFNVTNSTDILGSPSDTMSAGKRKGVR